MSKLHYGTKSIIKLQLFWKISHIGYVNKLERFSEKKAILMMRLYTQYTEFLEIIWPHGVEAILEAVTGWVSDSAI